VKLSRTVFFLFKNVIQHTNKKNQAEHQKGNDDLVEKADVGIRNCKKEDKH